MKVKKFTAKTMSDAMQLIRKEMGTDAIILQSKTVKKGGVFGLLQQKYIEVIAALDEEPLPEEPRHVKDDVPFPIAKAKPDQSVLREIQQLRQLVMTQGRQSSDGYPIHFQHAYDYLLKQEVAPKLAKIWIDKLVEFFDERTDMALEEIKEQLVHMLHTELEPMMGNKHISEKRIIQFVGPTGVGKTTTLAKVATKYMLEEKKKIAFITLDTYRIAAIEQLKTYARILQVPLEVAYSVQDYEQALRKFADYDVVFVDTPGRNFREVQYIQELKQLTKVKAEQVATYLVLSLTAKAEDVSDIFTQFNALPIEQVIFTKMDETLTYGSVLNILLQGQISLAYVTNGQDVPDDLIIPSSHWLSERILGAYEDV